MKKIVILSRDTKSVGEIQTWLKELSEETLVEAIKDPDEFRKKYCMEAAEEDANAKASAVDNGTEASAVDLDALGENSQRHFAISLFVVDLELLSQSPLEWVLETRDLLFQFGFSTVDAPTRVVLIGYEAAEFDIDKFRHDVVDDLVLKPLDRSLFLQKMELHLAEGQAVQGSFLFKQRTEMQIEMGKDTWIDAVSEFGFAIRNPAPLAAGVYARVYSRVFGEGTAAGLIGRVYRAERHPTEQGVYLCYLTYHGITSSQMSFVRKFIRQDRKHEAKAPIAPSKFEAPMKTAVVIDMNADSRDLIVDCLTSNFVNVHVKIFPSYRSFLKYCTRRIPGGTGSAPKVAPAKSPAGKSEASSGEALAEEKSPAEQGAKSPDTSVARRTLAGASELTFLVDGSSKDLTAFEPKPKANAKVLGVDAEELLERGSAWLSLFGDADKEEIEEFVTYLRSGQQGHIIVSANGGDEIGLVRLRMFGKIERNGETDGVMVLRLTIRELSEEEFAESQGVSGDDEISLIDSIYIDGSLLGEDPGPALEGITEVLRKARLLESREALSITIIGDERSQLRPADFRLASVQDFIYKPLDRKMVLAKAMLLTRGLIAKTDAVDLNYRKAGQPGRITKEVLMEELSEFGLQVRHNTPLREQTFLRFFSEIFLENGDGLLGRCLFSSKDPDTGLYHCFFSFFGVTDSQLKHIRNWIRGDYASRKEKAGG